ncbi:MAG: hypothetical protein RLZZ426_1224, partial [Actinomycetota bacterium]
GADPIWFRTTLVSGVVIVTPELHSKNFQ